jgi:hypothetical protein
MGWLLLAAPSVIVRVRPSHWIVEHPVVIPFWHPVTFPPNDAMLVK